MSREQVRQEGAVKDEPRQPEAAPYRCFWCNRWRCRQLMQICQECQAWYQRARENMPKGE